MFARQLLKFMITRIIIPQAFENMEEATIGAWLKAPGDLVHHGEAVCELITEKTTFDLPAEGAGVLLHIAAPEKSIVPVGFIIGVLGEAHEAVPDVDAENLLVTQRKNQAPEAAPDNLQVPSLNVPAAHSAPDTAAASGGSRIRATPAARRAARERGVTIEAVAAAFPGKVLSEEDVAKFDN